MSSTARRNSPMVIEARKTRSSECGRRSESALIRRGAESWHKFCRELLAARVRSDGSLSTPQAAGGGGQRPAFTGIGRPLKSAAEIGGVAASHVLLPRTFSDQAGKRAG